MGAILHNEMMQGDVQGQGLHYEETEEFHLDLEVDVDIEFQSFHGFLLDGQEGEPLVHSAILDLLNKFQIPSQQ